MAIDSETMGGLIRAAGMAAFGAALDLIQSDPHQWSKRPCPTCRAVSSIVGYPFGCEYKRQELEKDSG